MSAITADLEKSEIIERSEQQAASGRGRPRVLFRPRRDCGYLIVVIISSDAEEVIGLAHRILVIRGGRVVAELTGEDMTEQQIITAAFTEPAAGEPPSTAAAQTPRPRNGEEA